MVLEVLDERDRRARVTSIFDWLTCRVYIIEDDEASVVIVCRDSCRGCCDFSESGELRIACR